MYSVWRPLFRPGVIHTCIHIHTHTQTGSEDQSNLPNAIYLVYMMELTLSVLPAFRTHHVLILFLQVIALRSRSNGQARSQGNEYNSLVLL